ncbi:hypothetical protein D3C84_1091650 [compost metagenome]
MPNRVNLNQSTLGATVGGEQRLQASNVICVDMRANHQFEGLSPHRQLSQLLRNISSVRGGIAGID